MSRLVRNQDYSDGRPSRFGIFAKRQKRLVRPFCLLLFLIALALGGVWLVTGDHSDARLVVMRQKLGHIFSFPVKTIVVQGNNLTSRESVQDALGVKIGQSIFDFSVEEARQRLDLLPFVEHATIERRFPDSIVIRLQERRPFAVWQNHGHFVLIDQDGEVVTSHKKDNDKDKEAFLRLPLVVGAGANKAAASLLEVLSSFPDVQKHVAAAVRIGERRWNLLLRNKTLVYLPESAEQPAIKRLSELQSSVKILQRPFAVIDMRLADKLILRERPVPAPERKPSNAPTSPPSAGDEHE